MDVWRNLDGLTTGFLHFTCLLDWLPSLLFSFLFLEGRFCESDARLALWWIKWRACNLFDKNGRHQSLGSSLWHVVCIWIIDWQMANIWKETVLLTDHHIKELPCYRNRHIFLYTWSCSNNNRIVNFEYFCTLKEEPNLESFLVKWLSNLFPTADTTQELETLSEKKSLAQLYVKCF